MIFRRPPKQRPDLLDPLRRRPLPPRPVLEIEVEPPLEQQLARQAGRGEDPLPLGQLAIAHVAGVAKHLDPVDPAVLPLVRRANDVAEQQPAGTEASREGQVIVARGLGPRGTPGMGMGSGIVFAVLGAGLAGKVAVVTDGQLSGLTNVGITVAEVAPEAAAGGPIGLVENGDIISIDVAKRFANLEVSEAELEKLRASLTRWSGTDERGWLAIYRNLVEPVDKGRVLRK